MRRLLIALIACGVALAGIALLFLLPYPLKDFNFPVGWDAAYYVWRAKSVPFDGLDRIGMIRAATPLLMAVLMKATGQNALTLVAVVPAVLAGLVGLGAAAMVRAALGIRTVWIPVVAVLTWIAFGRIGMLNGHIDNVLNAAFFLSAFAAAVAFAAGGRGAVAVAVLFCAAALAEWPFYAFAVAVFLFGLLLFVLPDLRKTRNPYGGIRPVVPLLGATGVSVLFAGMTFLAVPEVGGVGLNIGRASIRELLRERFLARLGDGIRYICYPLALLGAVVTARVSPEPPAREGGRHLFLALMLSWIIASVLAGLAQLFGLPFAGARLMSAFFPATLLTGVLVWWVGRYLASRLGSPVGSLVAATVVLAVLAGFGALAWTTGLARVPYMEKAAVEEATTAGAYVGRYAADRTVVYLLNITGRPDASTLGRWWHVIRSALPAEQVPHAQRYIGTPLDYRAGRPSNGAAEKATAELEALHPVLIVLDRYNHRGFVEARNEGIGTVVGRGVLSLGGPVPAAPVTAAGPVTNTSGRSLTWLVPLLVALMYVAGSGWAMALLPPDAVIRACLAPVLGMAVVTLVALAWDRVGLGLGGNGALGPLVVAPALGWGAFLVAVLGRRRRRPA